MSRTFARANSGAVMALAATTPARNNVTPPRLLRIEVVLRDQHTHPEWQRHEIDHAGTVRDQQCDNAPSREPAFHSGCFHHHRLLVDCFERTAYFDPPFI
jgi:hypothetical protein